MRRHAPGDEVVAIEHNLSRAGLHDAGHAHQRRRLAGSVRADHGDALATVNGERDPMQHIDWTITGFEILNVQQGGTHDTSSLPRYASITFGSRLTSAGVPSAIFTP